MPTFHHEKKYGYLDGKVICGVDEVGRGPLAGPVTAAAAILPADLPRAIKKEIQDSKKMSSQARDDLYLPLNLYASMPLPKLRFRKSRR